MAIHRLEHRRLELMLLFKVFVLLVLNDLIAILVLERYALNRLFDTEVNRLLEGVPICLRYSLSLGHP